MHRKTIIITPEKFMDRFVPLLADHMFKRDERTSSILKNIPVASGGERKMYSPLVKALNDANICPGFQFVDTSSRGDGSERSNEAPDIGLYPSDRVPVCTTDPDGTEHSPPTDWSAVEFCIECKTNSNAHDPFEEKKGASKGIDPTTKERKEIFAQILAYAEFMFNRQQRMWTFMVLILGDHCRIIRFDRAGAVATQKFNYKTNGATLIEFLWRYAKWPESTRGHDPTAERILPGSLLAEQMQARVKKDKVMTERKDYACRLFEESLDPRWYWWKLRVEPDGKEGEDQFFVVGKPNFQAPGVVGRGTRGYVALPADNIADGKFCYLKDAWRVVGPDIDKEGTILEHLNEHDVEYIPTLECHGDVGDPSQQVTQTDALWEEMYRKNVDEGRVGENIVSPLKKHRHYRISVKQVGLQMSEFSNSLELVCALVCCIIAHQKAYEIGVIHRDISAGNVLLYCDMDAVKPQWCGLLNDWELSMKMDSAYPHGRQLDRTGTWQFMSAMTLTTPGELVRVEDELESFFNVLLYFAIRFLHHNCKRVGDFMYAYFDDYSTLDDNYGCGIYKRYCMETGRILLHPKPSSESVGESGSEDAATTKAPTALEALTFGWPTPSDPPNPHPLDHIIATILEWTNARYTLALKKATKLKGDVESPMPPPSLSSKSASGSDSSKRGYNFRGYKRPSGSPSTAELRASAKALAERNAELEAAAQKLNGHSAILDVFVKTVDHGVWPVNDKKPDQLPRTRYQHGADLTTAFPNLSKASGGMIFHGIPPSSTASSPKRRAAAVEELEVAGPSKRAK